MTAFLVRVFDVFPLLLIITRLLVLGADLFAKLDLRLVGYRAENETLAGNEVESVNRCVYADWDERVGGDDSVDLKLILAREVDEVEASKGDGLTGRAVASEPNSEKAGPARGIIPDRIVVNRQGFGNVASRVIASGH